MAVDPRQVAAGFLTLSMFVMLGNMIKHDHFSSTEVGSAKISHFPLFSTVLSFTRFSGRRLVAGVRLIVDSVL
jgi:hypothetical protein